MGQNCFFLGCFWPAQRCMGGEYGSEQIMPRKGLRNRPLGTGDEFSVSSQAIEISRLWPGPGAGAGPQKTVERADRKGQS